MKKSLSVAMVVAMVSSMFASMAFADDAATTTTTSTPTTAQEKFDALVKAGIFDADGSGNGADLNGLTTRAQIAKIVAKVYNLSDDAASASTFKDLDGSGWATGVIGAVAKAHLMEGRADGVFAPTANVKLEELAIILARAFKLDTTASTDVGSGNVDDWAKGAVAAALKAGLIPASTDFTKEAVRSDLATSAYAAVAKVKADADAEKAKQVAPLDVASAVALNSKVVELKLNTAGKDADIVASNVTVKDAAGTAVAVAGVKVAPYVTDGKTLLVTLGADTAVGTLYTLTSGTKSVNFGGRAVDSAVPTVTAVQSNDYNEVQLTFSEGVDISKLVVTAAEKYGTQTALKTAALSYGATSNVVKVATDAQKGATLYSLNISGAADFAGNAMAADTAQTFVGTAMDTAANTIAANGVTATTSKTVKVAFNKKVDNTTSLDKANYVINEAYGNKTAVAVSSVALDTTDTTGKTVVLTLSTDLTASTLYSLSVNNVKTIYGTAVTTAIVTNFVGVAKDTTVLPTPTVDVNNSNNTSIVLTFGANVADNYPDAATSKDSFVINEAYGNKAALNVKSVAVSNNTVTLTTDAQNAVLYNIVVKTGLKDAAGNATTADATVTYVGKAVAAKISSFNAALDNADSTQLKLTFNQNVGATATDVSHYTIDGGVGYPASAKVDSTNKNVVVLTVPKTNVNQLYTVTVKGLENSDGVAMDAAGVTNKFVGAGVTLSAPTLVAAIARDSQTLAVYFDQAVSSSKITGVIYDSTLGQVKAGQLSYQGNGAAVALDGAKAWVDPSNANVLLVRVAAAAFDTNAKTDGTFTLTGATASFVASKNTAAFAKNTTAAAAPVITGVSALNKNTVRVYFDQAVSAPTLKVYATADFNTTAHTGVNPISLGNAYAIDSSKTVYDFSSATDLTATTPYYLAVVGATDLQDVTGQVNAKDENSATGAKQFRQLAGSSVAPGSVATVPVTMSDDRTIVVWFPEAMDATSAKTVTNYTILNAAKTQINAANVVDNIAYDATTNKATITLNAPLAASTAYYLQFSNNIKNAVTVKSVANSDGTPVVSQFAPSATAAAKVTLSSASYDAVNKKVTVTLNQNASDVSDLTLATAGNYANLVAALKITVNSADSNATHDVVGTEITNVTFAKTAGVGNTIVITLAGGVTVNAGGVGKVALLAGLTGINGYGVDNTSTTVFAQ